MMLLQWVAGQDQKEALSEMKTRKTPLTGLKRNKEVQYLPLSSMRKLVAVVSDFLQPHGL